MAHNTLKINKNDFKKMQKKLCQGEESNPGLPGRRAKMQPAAPYEHTENVHHQVVIKAGELLAAPPRAS